MGKDFWRYWKKRSVFCLKTNAKYSLGTKIEEGRRNYLKKENV